MHIYTYIYTNISIYILTKIFRAYDSESVDGLVSDFRLVSGRVVSFSVLRTSLESGRLSC